MQSDKGVDIEISGMLFEPYIGAEQIAASIAHLAGEVAQSVGDCTPVFLCMLSGSFMFTADFVRAFPSPCEVLFAKFSSYCGTDSSGCVRQVIGLPDTEKLKGRQVIILEDIVDTGVTLREIFSAFEKQGLPRPKVAALLFKQAAFKEDFRIDYIGQKIENRFVIGYGMDCDERGRDLSAVYVLKNS